MQGLAGAVLPHYHRTSSGSRSSAGVLAQKRQEADVLFQRVGITFAVYGEEAGTERLIPFDIVRRGSSRRRLAEAREGLAQRVRALNMFLRDIYHEQSILRDGIIPPRKVLENAQYRAVMQGMNDLADGADEQRHVGQAVRFRLDRHRAPTRSCCRYRS